MTPVIKGLVIAVVQVGLVASLGAKLLYDRATLPRVRVRAAPYDPNLPIRGRYVRLRLVVEPDGLQGKKPAAHRELHDVAVPLFLFPNTFQILHAVQWANSCGSRSQFPKEAHRDRFSWVLNKAMDPSYH